jgi:L-lactate dehydrogenase complex protein LldF
MKSTSHAFPENAEQALADAGLQRALENLRMGFPARRRAAIERLPEFEALREEGRRIKDHVLAHLDFYLEAFERKVTERGGQVHWCRDAAEARQTVLEICRKSNARLVTKGKSMVAEEIALNDFLEKNGVVPVETDLGEHILQLRQEPPSHIIAPAIHLVKEQIAETFRARHAGLDPSRPLHDPRLLCDEARAVLRPHFVAADIGITGANLLIAETGSSVIVTNEGNGDLTQTLPRIHVVLASIEKIVPTLEDAATVLRLLARSATGQEFATYTSFATGPRRPEDRDGPAEYHVILLDNGRSAMLGIEFQDMLRCIRCAACLNHCPVYAAVGGHAYGWVYPGPMGAVLTPQFLGLAEARHLPNASTFCGRCESVCPMKIPLPQMMRHWREHEFAAKLSLPPYRTALAFWRFFALRPRLYRLTAAAGARLLGFLGRRNGRLSWLPLGQGWFQVRDLPAPQGRSFQSLWAEEQRRRRRESAAGR